jgi:hypothetical protein
MCLGAKKQSFEEASMQYQCVSGDDHMDLAYIPARLWQERVPAKFKDQPQESRKRLRDADGSARASRGRLEITARKRGA